MITSTELREKIRQISKKEKLSEISRSSFINNTFAGDFNYSIGEEPIMRKFGKYLPIEKNWSFSIFQPCIRYHDLYKEIKKNSENHLSVFEMADVGGIYLSNKKLNKNQRKEKIINIAIDFLTKNLKIDQKKIYASYFSGNTLDRLSENILSNKKYLPPDKKTHEFFKKLGFSEKQLLSDSSKKTFVLNFFPFEFYAGYRSELYVDLGKNKLLEVGTFEFLDYKSKLSGEGKLLDIEKTDEFLGGFALGIERTLMAVNHYEQIFLCDHIFPLYDKIIKLSKNRDEISSRILCESLRLIQAIINDGYDIKNDQSNKRRSRVRRIARNLSESSDKLGIDLEKNIDALLDINEKIVSWDRKIKTYDKCMIKQILRQSNKK